MANIGAEIQIWTTLRERLALAYELESDDDALLQTLEGELPLTDIILQMVRDAKQAKAFAEGLKTIIADNQSRKKRFEEKAEKLRELAAWAIQEAGITKPIIAPDMTISKRMGEPALVIDYLDEPDILSPYTKMKEVYSWDKDALRDAVESGKEDALAIAHMSNPRPILTVRSK